MIECPQCGKFITRRDNLIRHMKNVHNLKHSAIIEEISPLKEKVTFDAGNSGSRLSENNGSSNSNIERVDDALLEVAKSQCNTLKKINGNMSMEDQKRTSPEPIHRARKRVRLEKDIGNGESNNYESEPVSNTERMQIIREGIKTKVNALKRINEAEGEKTSPKTIEKAPKRKKDNENDESNKFITDNRKFDHIANDINEQPQNYENTNSDSEFHATKNNYYHMSESDDNKSCYEGSTSSKEEYDSCNEESHICEDDYSSEDYGNIKHKVRKIYWNDPNKLVDRLQELVSTEAGHEIFTILAALRKGGIIE